MGWPGAGGSPPGPQKLILDGVNLISNALKLILNCSFGGADLTSLGRDIGAPGRELADPPKDLPSLGPDVVSALGRELEDYPQDPTNRF